MSTNLRIAKKAIFLLLAVTLVIGLFIFRDYGLTWDEPLFYKYADALGYAYTPSNWFSGHFDINQSYGPSGDDHKNRGPGYLLLAREPVYLLNKFGVDDFSAWHLLNFVTFLLGVYFLYRLCERLMSSWAAFGTSALFAFQPLLWGHAFINPKDVPFLVFLTGSVWMGFRMVDQFADLEKQSTVQMTSHILLPALLLGIATANRVLGPLAGILVLAYFLTRRPNGRTTVWILVYAAVSIIITFASWPFLWEGPTRFLETFQFMSANPTVLPILFGGQAYAADDLPRRYLPFFLFFTLTEFVWPLFVVGILAIKRKLTGNSSKLVQALLILAWLVIPFAYVVVLRPPIYDGMRHFLFILPPVFVFAGLGFEFLFEKLNRDWLNRFLVVVMLVPGWFAIVQLHPYEYTYYNSFVGGVAGAFRQYETDYWLTCYKEAVQDFDRLESQPVKLYVHREAEVAAPYASANVSVLDERGAKDQIQSGDYILVNTRTNEDRQTFHDAPVLLTVERAGSNILHHQESPMTTHRERLQTCIRGGEADRTPVALWRHYPVDDQSPEALAAAHLAYQKTYDFDLVKVTPASSFCLKDWAVDDAWEGNPEGTRRYVKAVVTSPSDWERLPVLDPSAPHLAAQLVCLRLIRKELGPETPILQTIFNPLAQAKHLANEETLLVHLRKYPEAVMKGLETIAQTTRRFIEAAIETGIDGVFYAVQHAQAALLAEEEFERFSHITDLALLEAGNGLWCNMLHIHGDAIYFDSVANYPVQIINWHDRETPPSLSEAMASEAFKTSEASVLCGGLSREALVYKTPVEIQREASDAIQQTGGRGLILSTGCVVPVIAPHGNLQAARQSVNRESKTDH